MWTDTCTTLEHRGRFLRPCTSFFRRPKETDRTGHSDLAMVGWRCCNLVSGCYLSVPRRSGRICQATCVHTAAPPAPAPLHHLIHAHHTSVSWGVQAPSSHACKETSKALYEKRMEKTRPTSSQTSVALAVVHSGHCRKESKSIILEICGIRYARVISRDLGACLLCYVGSSDWLSSAKCPRPLPYHTIPPITYY